MTEARGSYHHGNLREELVRVARDLARSDGAEAIGLREATRRAGVTARAAYRHFADRDALVIAVAVSVLDEMAETIAARQVGQDEGAAMLTAVGEGYIAFALDEPGWFDVAFFAMGEKLQPGGQSPYTLLEEALAALVAEGRLAPERVDDAVMTCWSGVHGFATLTSRGPLRALPRETIDDRARRRRRLGRGRHPTPHAG
ncbi:TetR/AcrR family transcriptional regulator [Nocardioides sp. B-3]|uniref:TetR/AcrR family transcriptional regulator n=1 Tax=Nocardioides sp. B-3 TaxID=2895565 RepID=UPI0021536863|nr:TetR/AcrR family transcriptional regulator [Nocardioides sp. B-3]UUZ60490.1 TetR/AcrR family transcriptional regulator [Nocardioides sp. B-3]